MRLFIAIELPQGVKAALSEVATQLAQSGVHASWARPETLHITLKFLGEVADNKLDDIRAALDRVAAGHTPFQAQAKEFGFFPPRGRPRVFFVGSDQPQRLQALARDLEQELAPLGFEIEGGFKAHITLARFKGGKNLAVFRDQLAELRVKESFPVAVLVLFRSTLTPRGAIHEEVYRTNLTV